MEEVLLKSVHPLELSFCVVFPTARCAGWLVAGPVSLLLSQGLVVVVPIHSCIHLSDMSGGRSNSSTS